MRPISLPDRALRCRSYDELRSYTFAFARGELGHIAVLGPPGVGKSECVRRAMAASLSDGEWSTLRGHATPLALFEYLFENANRPIVIDDVDELLGEAASTAMLKSALESGSARRISWRARGLVARGDEPPEEFEFSGRCAIIANASRIRSADIEAIYDRCVCIYFEPTASDVHREIAAGGWFTDEEVFSYLGQNLHLVRRPSLRFYLQVQQLRRAGLVWRDMASRMLQEQNSAELIVVQQLINNVAFDQFPQPAAERAEAFRRRTGKSRASYFRIKRELDGQQTADDIVAAASLGLSDRPHEGHIGTPSSDRGFGPHRSPVEAPRRILRIEASSHGAQRRR